MANIQVNHQALRDAANAIEEYCSSQNSSMRHAHLIVKAMLSVGWTGADADQFRLKWESIDDKSSAAIKFRKSLKDFAEYLIACADAYQKAQEDAYNEANRLPKYLYW